MGRRLKSEFRQLTVRAIGVTGRHFRMAIAAVVGHIRAKFGRIGTGQVVPVMAVCATRFASDSSCWHGLLGCRCRFRLPTVHAV